MCCTRTIEEVSCELSETLPYEDSNSFTERKLKSRTLSLNQKQISRKVLPQGQHTESDSALTPETWALFQTVGRT